MHKDWKGRCCIMVQVAVHAIGDAANDHVLSIFETVVSKNGPRDRRFRVSVDPT